ncbi:hypothetical protein BaRGS_00036361 [Batillaria attramentaria]|uniref:Uncharacterized protein n=1 Tax=Batillaria attramentaria TaxID=370345 RepID=A0ABD0JBL2_9CAEN
MAVSPRLVNQPTDRLNCLSSPQRLPRAQTAHHQHGPRIATILLTVERAPPTTTAKLEPAMGTTVLSVVTPTTDATASVKHKSATTWTSRTSCLP